MGTSAARQAPTSGDRADGTFVIPSLDGIRALAVSVVFLGHAGINRSPGPLGVTVFFFLSGFLIATLMRVEFERKGKVNFGAFYLRRAFRLLPPLYIVLGAACTLTLLGFFGPWDLHLNAVLAQFFYLSNYQILQSGWDGPHSGRPPGTGDLWSLAVEEHFYLVFPLLFVLVSRFTSSARRQALMLGALCAGVLAWRLILVLLMQAPFDRTYAGSDTRVDSILFGAVLAVWGNPFLATRATDGGGQGSAWSRLWAPILAPVAILAILLSISIRDVRFSGTFQYTIQGIALIPLFTVAVRYHRHWLFRPLNWRWVRFVGALSYSIYISEQVIIFGVHRWLAAPQIVRGVVYLVLTLLVATCMYYVVERPAARVRRRLSQLAARPAVAGAQTRMPSLHMPSNGGAGAATTAAAAPVQVAVADPAE